LNHLMASNQLLAEARRAVRCGSSDKRRNAGEGLIWPTEGRLLALAERRCGRLMVGQTTAPTAPRQPTPKAGQMIQSDLISL
jgi:hypothetical protein